MVSTGSITTSLGIILIGFSPIQPDFYSTSPRHSEFEQRFEYLTKAVNSYHRTVIVTAAVH